MARYGIEEAARRRNEVRMPGGGSKVKQIDNQGALSRFLAMGLRNFKTF